MANIIGNIKMLTVKYPMIRGMMSYSVIWPASCLIQQTLDGKSYENYDAWRVMRYGLYGSLFVAPTLYGWVKLSTAMWPKTSLRTALVKAAVEQVSYTPAANISFYFLMSLMEMKTIEEASAEVKAKFLPTYKLGICVWPAVATINNFLIPERNRVVVYSVCSLIWTTYLAFMKHSDTS